MKPGDLVRWTGDDGIYLVHTGDLILVAECGLKKTSTVEYVKFILNGIVLEMTERWFILNTEPIDETR